MADEGTPTDPTRPQAPWTDTPWTDDDPLAADSADPANAPDAEAAAAPAAPAGPRATRAATTAAMTAWSNLDNTSQLVVGGSLAVIAIAILGVPFGAWASADFVLIVLAAAIIGAVAGWLGSGSAKSMPIPLSVVELGVGAVVGLLAIWNLIEILFDLDQDDRGGVIGWVFTAGLAVAGTAVLIGALRRNGGLRSVAMSDDMWARVAAGGLALVLVGWALNLSISYWTMAQAALSLAVLALATVSIVAARRIEIPVLAAWTGVVLAAFGAILAIGQWGDLTRIGATRIELDPTDILAFLIYVLGIGLIIAGGVLTALELGPKKPAGEASGDPAGDEASPAA